MNSDITALSFPILLFFLDIYGKVFKRQLSISTTPFLIVIYAFNYVSHPFDEKLNSVFIFFSILYRSVRSSMGIVTPDSSLIGP